VSERLVVIGGDAAGMSAAAQVRRLRKDMEIVVFERGVYTSYAACGLPYLVGGDVDSPDRLVARTPEEFRSGGIDVRTCHEVASIDTEHRMVRVIDHEAGTVQWEGYDELLIATGGSPVRPPLPGMDADGVFDVRTIPDADAVRRALDGGAGSAVVVGGGYIGVEMAESLVRRGLRVTMVEQADQPMLTMDADMAALVTGALTELGVDVRLGAGVTSFATVDGRLTGVVTESGSFAADLAVIGLGVRPNTALAVDADIPVGPSGGIVVDERMHTQVDGIWAAGDCVESRHRVSGRQMVVALGTHANKQGRVAGTNIGGGAATFGGVLGTAITRVGRTEVARTGLSEREAAENGFDAVAVATDAKTVAGYLSEADEMRVKIVAERGTGRLLGAQIVGGAGAGKRIDVLAAALWNEMTVAELSGMDLAYAPPFSPVWDPVLLAAGKAAVAIGTQ
jgi:NADPH-dependent 2,4-dienoyl-CoA reductase/sulfur reductase-like enzyme